MDKSRRAVSVIVGFVFACCLMLPLSAAAEVITFTDPDTANWYVDRKMPAVFEQTVFDGDSRLHIGISGANVQPDSFYNYQGMKRDFNAGISRYDITADLYVDSSWTDANIGIWATLFDPSNAVSGYPIVAWREKSDNSIAAGFYAFDYINGGWLTIGTGYQQNTWHTIGMHYTPSAMEYYIDGVMALSFSDNSQNGTWGNIILNSYNFGNNYDVYWDNVGTVPTPEPGTMVLLGLGASGLALLRWQRGKREV